jgi:hypothetical protein
MPLSLNSQGFLLTKILSHLTFSFVIRVLALKGYNIGETRKEQCSRLSIEKTSLV